MSLRTRLLLAMLVVVALTTVTSLLLAQRQNRATYRTLANDLFTLQSRSWLNRQGAEDRTAAAQLEQLAASVRLFAAMEENDPDIYNIAADELRQGNYAFFRLLDRQGSMLEPPPDGRAGLAGLKGIAEHIPAAALARAQGRAQLGYVVLNDRDGTEATYRILAVPIVSFGTHVGTLVSGQPVADIVASGEAGQQAAGLRVALIVANRVVGASLPDSLAAALRAQDDRTTDATGSHATEDGETWLFSRSRLNPGSLLPPAWLASTLSTAAFDAEQRALGWRIAMIGLLAAALAGLLSLVLSRWLSQPIARLVRATHAIGEGNYALRLPLAGAREMSQLSASFNDMAAGLELKERYHSVLQQVADPQVAEGLIAGHVKLGGELRDVTVMFCDIRGYTALSVGRNPEEIIELLNHHMSAMTAVVQAHRGVINQFAGDAIMALFGAPRSYGDDAERAVTCALAMMAERERLNAIVHEPVRVGIGLASGEMVAGCIGAENRNDYTVVGERVNLAARLCSTAKSGEVLIDEITRGRISNSFATTAVPPLTLKGFATPMPAYLVTRA